MIEALQMLVGLGVPALVIVLLNWFRSQDRRRLVALVRDEAEAGRSISAETIRALSAGQILATPRRDLRRGAVLVAMGGGLVLIGLCAFVGIASSEGMSGAVAVGAIFAGVGAIPLCIGAAFLYLSRADRDLAAQ